MIDEKKIKETADKYAQNECGYSYDVNKSIAFEDGANWAINEFLKGLWHDASKKPNFDEDCLVELDIPNPKTGAYEAKDYAVSQYDCTLTPDECPWYGEDIDNILVEEHGKITRWLYIEDLTKGGK